MALLSNTQPQFQSLHPQLWIGFQSRPTMSLVSICSANAHTGMTHFASMLHDPVFLCCLSVLSVYRHVYVSLATE